MTTPELLNYIRAAVAQGQSFELTKTLLLQNGWSESDIMEAKTALGISSPADQASRTTSPELRANAEGQVARAEPYGVASPISAAHPSTSLQDAQKAAQSSHPSYPLRSSPPAEQFGKKREWVAVTISIAVILFVLGGGGTFAYFSFIKESWFAEVDGGARFESFATWRGSGNY